MLSALNPVQLLWIFVGWTAAATVIGVLRRRRPTKTVSAVLVLLIRIPSVLMFAVSVYALEYGVFKAFLFAAAPLYNFVMEASVADPEIKADRDNAIILVAIASLGLGAHLYNSWGFLAGPLAGNSIRIARELIVEQRSTPSVSGKDASSHAVLAPGNFIAVQDLSDTGEGHNPVFEPAHLGLPIPVAKKDSDVRYVVVILGRSAQIRTYVPTSADYQWVFQCYIIDTKSRSIDQTATFYGSAPRKEGGFAVDRYGDQPWHDVKRWLLSSEP